MGCTNRATSDVMARARTGGDAERPVPAGSSGAGRMAGAVKAVQELDRTGDVAILRVRSGEGNATASDRAAYGDVAESAAARHIVEKLGHELIHQNTERGEKGIDLVTFDPDSGSLVVWEFKSSLSEHALKSSPRMGSTKDGRQMSEGWIDARLEAAGLDKATAGDVETRAVKVDLRAGKALIWDVDPQSGVKTTAGSPVDIEDLLDLQR
jgi:hypothetical protein